MKRKVFNMEEILEQLELVDVNYDENNKKATMIFLHEEKQEIREVSFNKQIYDKDTEKYIDDPEKAKQVDEWCNEYFQLPFEELPQAIGERKDVYCYPKFNSLWHVKQIAKFEEDMIGQIFETEVIEVVDDGDKISIQFMYEGELYESKMQYSEYIQARNGYFVNPLKEKSNTRNLKKNLIYPLQI